MAINGLKIGDVISNKELCAIFKCSSQGGMRRSTETNTLVLVSNHVKALYDDRWIGDVFHYTGMGLIGDQNLEFFQNKTLAESKTNGINVHLFEVFRKGQYTYIGEVELADSPYWEVQNDIENKPRKVIIFPLKLKQAIEPILIEKEVIEELERQKERRARELSIDKLRDIAQNQRGAPGQRRVSTTYYIRNEYVSSYVKRRANGKCQLCEQPAPFKDKSGEPYLETHHVTWLSEGGEDSIENTIALCPNCHKKMHVLNLEEDRKRLLQIARK